MAMTTPTPHKVSSTRITYDGGEKYSAPDAVLSGEPALVVPFQPGETTNTFMGPAETNRFVMFIDFEADVQMGDIVTNDDTGETYAVVAPPVKYQNPSTWENDHAQVELKKQPIGA